MKIVDVVVCSSCRSLDGRRVRLFRLTVELQLVDAATTKPAGRALLCEPCWARLVGAIAR